MEIAEALDPQGRIISGRLGRESTIMGSGGRYIKDLSYLGRPLKDVIYIDFNDENVPHHKENCIVLPEWRGERDDRALIDLVPFLENLAQKQVDVREELKNYTRDNTAETFNRMQAHRRDMIQRQRESGGLGMLSSISKQH